MADDNNNANMGEELINMADDNINVNVGEGLINMANDNNNNADNADNQEEVDPDFLYCPDHSTTCIFARNFIANSCVYRWRGRDPSNQQLPFAPISSSHGLLLHHLSSYSTSLYLVGNPFCGSPFEAVRTLEPHPCVTHAVLAANPDGIFVIIRLLSNRTQGGNISYDIGAYSSSCGQWLTLASNHILHNDADRVIIPNSGTSCGRFAYWLTWLASSRSSVLVVRVDTKSSVDPVRYPLLTYLELPDCVPNDVVTINLGRAGRWVGLSVADVPRRRVDLYRIQGSTADGDDNVVPMRGWTWYPQFLDVILDPAMEEGLVDVEGPLQIRCRGVPKPIRFESYKIEVLLLVGGYQRQAILLWESRRSNMNTSRVSLIRAQDLAGALPYVEDRGVPHVTTRVLPSIATLEEE